jgi:hypothetical protein
MTEGQEHAWHDELDYMRAQLRWVLNNLDNKPRFNDVKGKIEVVVFRLNDLCELTQGESK